MGANVAREEEECGCSLFSWEHILAIPKKTLKEGAFRVQVKVQGVEFDEDEVGSEIK